MRPPAEGPPGGRPSRRGHRILLTLVLLALTASCLPGGSSGDPELERVRAVVLPYLTTMPFHIAAQEGYFAEQGLDVEFTRIARSHDIMTALASGEVDVASAILTLNEINQAAGGARLRMVASLGEMTPEGCGYTAVVARREHVESGALEDPERIRELRFDIDVLRPLGYWTDRLLQPLGLSIDDIETTYVPPTATVEAIRSGTIDVTIEGEPFLTMMEATGETEVWRTIGEIVPGYQISMVQYGRTLLDERPEVGRRLAVALLKGIRRYRQGKTPANLDIVQRATGLSAEHAEAACWPVPPVDGRIETATLRDYMEWSARRDLVERVLDDDELFDHRFIDHANRALGR